ncbi:MAG: hypothetical protein EOP11_06745 [Proteobacteria bacterium]|nr:MAG: hypothetical protein EOP11_06745 [Pseudomonadota bacterium]
MNFSRFKPIFAGMPLALLLSLPPAYAEESIWEEAFPETCETEGCARAGFVMRGEVAAGGVITAVSGVALMDKNAGITARAEIARLAALEELRTQYPHIASTYSEDRQVKAFEGIHAEMENDTWRHHANQSQEVKEIQARRRVLDSKADELRAAEKFMKTREAEILADLKAGRPVPPSVTKTVQAVRKRKLMAGTWLAAGLAMVGEAGFRLGALSQGKQPGYLPMVASGQVAIKRSASPASAPLEALATTMTVRIAE